MEQRIIKLERENVMLRSVIKNMQTPTVPTNGGGPSGYGSMQPGGYGAVPQGPSGGYGMQAPNYGF